MLTHVQSHSLISARSSHPPKLVLCVIDAMAPAMLERAVAAGEAPTLAALMERGLYVPDCVAAFPSVTPVCAASIVTGVWQERHHIPGMCWYDRAERRYVEYGSSFRASQRVGLDTPADRHRLQHERRAPLARHADRVRDARRRGRSHRRHHLPDVPRPPPPRAPARQPADTHRLDPDAPLGDGAARAVLRGHLREPPHRLPLDARHARSARPPLWLRRGLHGRARPVRLPAAVAAGQRLALPPRRGRRDRCARSRLPTSSSRV